jgi:hypothetical protein
MLLLLSILLPLCPHLDFLVTVKKKKEEKIHFHRHLDLRRRRRDDANRWEYIARPISDFMCGAPEL